MRNLQSAEIKKTSVVANQPDKGADKTNAYSKAILMNNNPFSVNQNKTKSNYNWCHVDDDLDDLDIYKDIISETAPMVALEQFTSSMGLIRRLNGTINIPRLVLIDLNMPVMNGLACLQHVKILPHINQFTRLVILSTNSQKEMIDHCYSAGAHFYAIKPSSPEGMRSLVSKLVEIADSDLKWPIPKKQYLLNPVI